MILTDYMIKNKRWLSYTLLAHRIGISRQSLYDIAYGKRSPTLVMAHRIITYCKPDVTYDDLLQPFLQKGREYLADGRILTGINSRGPRGRGRGILPAEKKEDDDGKE